MEHTQSYMRIPVWPEIRDSSQLSRTVLRVCAQFYYVWNYVIYVLLAHIITHTEQIILRNTTINNSLRASFSFRMLRTSTIFTLVVHQTIVRAFNRYLFLSHERYIPCFLQHI